jgi:cathepsin C
MVYDEGFNVETENYSFFAFSKYEKNNSRKFFGSNLANINSSNSEKFNVNFNSKCFSTCIGWYHNKDKSKWGCYQANKLNVDSQKITKFNSKNNINIVEPENITQNIIDTIKNIKFKSIGDSIIFPNEKIKDNNDINIKINLINKNMKKFKSKTNLSSFITEKENIKLSMRLKLKSSFRNHNFYVSKLKEIKKNWDAEVDPNFNKMTIKELNNFAGQKTSNKRLRAIPYKINEDVSEYPKSFDWKKFLKPAGSQGNCGSCYAYSTMRMMEARLKIAFNHDVDLSVQHTLDCSIYNQGCDGGYPFLVMKYASEFELIPETCKPYMVIEIIIKIFQIFNLYCYQFFLLGSNRKMYGKYL